MQGTNHNVLSKISYGLRYGCFLNDDFLLYTVLEVNDDEVTVDGNHPLAGKTLTFNCTVMGVRAATDEELTHGHVHDADTPHLH